MECTDDDDVRTDYQLRSILPQSTDSESTNSNLKPAVSISEQLIGQVDTFYSKNKDKFMSNAVIPEDGGEMNNEESFKIIYRFSKRQSAKLDNRLPKAELPKFKHNFLNNQNERLAGLLDERHLKVKKVYNPDDSEPEELEEDNDDDEEEEDGKPKKISLNEKLAKRFNKHCEKVELKRNILKHMYNKALQNQENSKKYSTFNSLEKSYLKLGIKSGIVRPKTSTSIVSKYEQSQQFSNSNFELNNSSIRPKTALANRNNTTTTDKLQIDISRNNSNKTYPFRLSINEFNSNVEVFKP